MVESRDKARPLSFRAVALALATAAVVVLTLLNIHQLWIYRQPTDGMLWQRTGVGATSGLEAVAGTVGAQGLRIGDRLVAINGEPVATPEAVARQLYRVGIGQRLEYDVARGAALLAVGVEVRPTRPPLERYAFLELVGLLYLAVGLFVLYRRQRAPQALHFYLFCLASVVLYCFHFTGKLNAFDHTIFWSNEAALLLVPCLLVHFALRFQSRPGEPSRFGGPLAALLYLPAVLLGLIEVGLATGAIWLPATLSAVQDVVDRASYAMLAVYFVAAAVLFARKARRSGKNAVWVRQARVMSWGTGAAIGPFLALYIVPLVAGADLPRFANLSVLSLALIPLAFGYAIWRHHLLEAEMAFRRGVVYTLATAAVVGVYLTVIGLAGVLIHSHLPTWGWAGTLLAILVTALLFEPLKHWLQERLDRMFYRERYDYRRTLVEFARSMSAQPELDPLLQSVLERLARTLSLVRAAVFIARPGPDAAAADALARGAGDGTRLALVRSFGLEVALAAGGERDLAFLEQHFLGPEASPERLCLESPEEAPPRLELYYYLPCRLQGRTVAVLGLGKTTRGEYLSGDDLALVETLAGYLAIALENARLYATLRQEADAYQRLKDFNENIVESIQVGVIAVNLEGKVESWNAQMEALTGWARGQALGQPLAGLLGAEFGREFQLAGAGAVRSLPKFRMGVAGQDKIFNLAIAPLLTARFERVGQIVLLSDITAEVELEQRLIQADRLRSVGLLAAGVAHEVNTPLAVISSHAQMLAKQAAADAPMAAVLETITRQTFRASEIISNLLNFSRTGEARFRRVEVNAVVRDTLALVEHPLRSAGIHVIAALHPAPVEVLGDPGKLQQVFLNLVLNARDAMAGGGTLRLSTGCAPERAWIEVADTGAGIAPELHHRIFDPFFTTKAASPRGATMSTGTGLGLAVTYGIVQEHGGTIRVKSEPCRGAEFIVDLPLLAPQAVPAEPVVA